MNRRSESHAFLREPSCPWWSTTRQATTKATKVHEESRQHTLLHWLKFNLVGGIGIGVQLAALALLRSGLHVEYLLATALAVETAVLHNFLWHERFTWADRGSSGLRVSLIRLAKFNVSNGAVSILGNLLLMRLLVGEFKVNYVAANLIAIIACSLANFLLSDRFVFEREGHRFRGKGNVTLAG